MRLGGRRIVATHDALLDVGEEDHHPRATSFSILINSQAIPAGSAWEYRVDLGDDRHRTLRAVLRGNQNVDIQGHTGVFVLGSDSSGQCSGIGIKPYGSGYVTSYMGGYSRIHGDSYLTPPMFGGGIRLRDAYIDGTDAVLEFFNPAVIQRFMSCYGAVAVK
jgi:hypothetical protein